MPYRRQRKGEQILATTINEPIAGLEQQERAASGPGARVGNHAGLPVHQAEVDGAFFARVASATATPGKYNLVEVTEAAAGAWADILHGRNVQGWEFNLATGIPIGKIVRVRWFGGAGEYRFLLGGCAT